MLLFIIFSILSISTFAFAAESTEDVSSPEDFTYVENSDGTVGITEYHGTSLNVVIPDTYNGKNVTVVAQDTFSNKKDIESVVWSNNVDCVDGFMFENCINLKKVVLTPSVNNIYTGAFKNCTSLADITIPEGLVSIYPQAFFKCTTLENIKFPNTLSEIKDNAFAGCWKLKAPDFGENLSYIGKEAFASCYEFIDVKLPDTVMEISDSAFLSCNQLKSINIPIELEILGKGVFFNTRIDNIIIPESCKYFTLKDNILFSKDMKNLELAPRNISGDYEIPQSVSVIKESSFDACYNLTGIKIPSNVYKIESNAFHACSGLKTLDFSGASVDLDYGCFYGCNTLNNILGSENIKTLGGCAFMNCMKVTDFNFGDALTKIGYEAFRNCYGIKEFVIPKNVTSIAINSFEGLKEGSKIYNKSSAVLKSSDTLTTYSMLSISLNDEKRGSADIDRSVAEGIIVKYNSEEYIKCGSDIPLLLKSNDGYIISGVAYSINNIPKPYILKMPYKSIDLKVVFSECTNHEYYDLEIINAATCTEDGEKKVSCTICNGKYNMSIPKLGHDYSTEFTIDKEPTCTVPGEKSRHCTRCDVKTEITTVEPLGHDYSADFKVDKEPTCTVEGEKSKYCTRCNERGEVTSIPALGHDYPTDFKVDKEPTCTVKGEKSKHCTRCDERSEITSVSALGHNYSKDYTIDKEATCVEEGIKSRHCTRCDAYTDQIKITATGNHKYNSGVITTPSTCSKKGVKTYTCSVCKRTKTEEIDTTPHDYAKYEVINPTCTSKGYTKYKCRNCDNIKYDNYTDMIPHKYVFNQILYYPTCTEDGERLFNCSECGTAGYQDIPAYGHDYVLFTTIKPTIYQEGFGTYICKHDARHRFDYVIPKLKAVSLVRLNAGSKTLAMGGSYYLKASVYPGNAANKSVSWKSSNTKVATVNTSGKVYFKSPGKAYIYATAKDGSGKSAKATVKVLPKKVVKIKLSSSKKKVTVSIAKTGGAKHYEIYRSTKKNKGFKKIKKTASRKYVNKKLKSKKTYYYKVRAVYGSYAGSFSKVYKVKVK